MSKFADKNIVYINLVPITDGGGLQNAASFLETMQQLEKQPFEYFVIFKKSSLLQSICDKGKIKYRQIGTSYISRLIFESTFFIRRKGAIIFTLFGLQPLVTFNCLNIVGCAYSNLFYPEIPFWKFHSKPIRVYKKLVDSGRKYFLKKADYWIFETEFIY